MGNIYRISWAMVFITTTFGGMKMSVDEYDFRMNSPILYGFYTSEIAIQKVPYPTLTLLPAESFKLSGTDEAKE
jgi:hypothetical protein